MEKTKLYKHTVDAEIAQKLLTINEIYAEAELGLDTFYAINWNNHRTGYTKIPTHVAYLAFINFKNFIIEISKLLKDSTGEYYNLFSLARFIARNKHDYNIDNKIINELISDLRKNQRESIDIILKMRNKRFAHTDEDYQTIKSHIGNSETSVLLSIVKKIIDHLNETVKINPEKKYLRMKGIGHADFWDDVYIKMLV
ncbi:hypothetical protein [Sphingobacterium sp.]|uniref:hypothetical protein n=1 Tax=Sphingobacterium sp. TaxID=341027 RepID=UPI002FDD6799